MINSYNQFYVDMELDYNLISDRRKTKTNFMSFFHNQNKKFLFVKSFFYSQFRLKCVFIMHVYVDCFIDSINQSINCFGLIDTSFVLLDS